MTSNTPSGMGSYGCRNDQPLIESWCGTPAPVDPDKNCAAADPVLPANGVTTISESDFVSGDDTPLVFSRTYRSSPFIRTDSGIGAAWFYNWQKQLGLANATGNLPQVVAYRADGNRVTFNKTAGVWRPVDGSSLTLTQGSSSWTLLDLTTETTESYSAQGILLSVSTRTGTTTTLTYSDSSTPASIAPSPGLLISVTAHAASTSPNFDLTLRFGYDTHWRITQMTDPTGAVTQYGYDAHGNLVSVTWPDGNVRRYVYDDPRFLSLLTGVVDETGSRIATWTYDSQGRATAVSHPDTTRNVQFVYGSGTTTLSDSQGSTSLTSSLIAGMQRPTVINSTSGTGSVTWDASGHLLTQKTGNGDSVAYAYDDAGRPIQSVTQTASGITTLSIRYADATTLRPSLIASPGMMRAFTYDASGNVTGASELTTDDPTGSNGFNASTAGGQVKTSGMTYDSSNRVTFAQLSQNGVVTAQWWITRDQTGNLRQLNERLSGQYYRVPVRDTAHRAIVIDGAGFEANPVYDYRGRVSTFWYVVSANSSNDALSRLFKVTYGYSPDGRVVSRTATLATSNGPELAVSSDQIDQWLASYEKGVAIAFPSLPGSLQSSQSTSSTDIEPVCASCYLWAAQGDAMKLYYSGVDRGQDQPVSDLTLNPLPAPRSMLGATKCADSCAEERAACTDTCTRASGDFNQPRVWTGKWKTCMRSCMPARCGGF